MPSWRCARPSACSTHLLPPQNRLHPAQSRPIASAIGGLPGFAQNLGQSEVRSRRHRTSIADMSPQDSQPPPRWASEEVKPEAWIAGKSSTLSDPKWVTASGIINPTVLSLVFTDIHGDTRGIFNRNRPRRLEEIVAPSDRATLIEVGHFDLAFNALAIALAFLKRSFFGCSFRLHLFRCAESGAMRGNSNRDSPPARQPFRPFAVLLRLLPGEWDTINDVSRRFLICPGRAAS